MEMELPTLKKKKKKGGKYNIYCSSNKKDDKNSLLPYLYHEIAKNGKKDNCEFTELPEQRALHSLWLNESTRHGNSYKQSNNTLDKQSEINLWLEAGNSVKRKVKKNKKGAAYVHENYRMKKLRKNLKRTVTDIIIEKRKPLMLDKLIVEDNKNFESAVLIQRNWRAYCRKLFWIQYFEKVKASTKIQCIIRGVLTRKLVRLWHLERVKFVSKIQGTFRSYLYGKIIATIIQWESYNASLIQSTIRGFLLRKDFQTRKLNRASIQIQSLWRGYMRRKELFEAHMNSNAAFIQKSIRRYLGMKYYRLVRRECQKAAILIQKCFRGVLGRQSIAKIMEERETVNLKHYMEILQIEVEWHKDYRRKLVKRLDRSKLEQKVISLEKQLYEAHEEIFELETQYIDIQMEKRKVSPRAIEQGWTDEVNKNVQKYRNIITKKKLDTIFGIGLDFQSNYEVLRTKQEKIKSLGDYIQSMEKWREEEYEIFYSRESNNNVKREKYEKLKRIAETKRKWRIKYFTKEGKPDTKRRDGYPWDPDVYAGPEKQIFCSGSADILAFCKTATGSNNEDGMPESGLQTAIDQLTLVNTESEIAQKEQLLQPILDVVQKKHDEVCAKNVPKNSSSSITEGGIITISCDSKHVHSPQKVKKNKSKPEIKSARVPWILIDQLETERKKLKAEISLSILFNK